MALIQCRTCGGSVASGAECCPHCGERDFTPPPPWLGPPCPYCRKATKAVEPTTAGIKGFCENCGQKYIGAYRKYLGKVTCAKCRGKRKVWITTSPHPASGRGNGSSELLECPSCIGNGWLYRYHQWWVDYRTGRQFASSTYDTHMVEPECPEPTRSRSKPASSSGGGCLVMILMLGSAFMMLLITLI